MIYMYNIDLNIINQSLLGIFVSLCAWCLRVFLGAEVFDILNCGDFCRGERIV